MAKKQFKAESKRLMDLMINSIYTHKEIFLREIISNASDAIDKLNYKVMTDASVGISKEDLRIRISVDKDARIITVSDNGIGMSKEDMDANLGVIAHSGSLDFKANADVDSKIDIIGQFGVGFYSAFMVSDNVAVISKAYGSDKAYSWISEGVDGYNIKECEKDSVGTDVVMHLKPDTKDEKYSDFLESYSLQNLVKKYSDYIRWPIHMDVESGEWEDTGKKDKDGKPKEEYVTKIEDKVVNSMIPIWQRSKKDASDEDCMAFYRDKFRDMDDPVSVIRANAEGAVSYKAMLFIPKKAPYDFYTRDFESGLQLYSSGVLIMDKCADLLPYCFRFVRGIVDSQDFSLNLSREVLQQTQQLRSVASNLKKKVKNELSRLMNEEPEKYLKFYESFGRQLKYGVVEDYGSNKDILKDLIMFYSSKDDKLISLADYVKGMSEGQDRIYYVSADTPEHAKQLPQTEPVRERGYDVLCLTEEVDEFVMKALNDFEGKTLCNITSDDPGLETADEKKDTDSKEEESKDLLAFMKETLGDKVATIKISHRLKNHAVLLTTEGGVTLEMEKYFQSIPGDENRPKAKRVLEVNASHPAFLSLKETFVNDKDKASNLVKIMYLQASIVAGVPPEDLIEYSDLVFGLF
ncbi:MAG: molecular chaperone HtpG [Candidatus Cloacimonetes bacterium]|nr:molecular chaperone HtpG [Candidatus Cloacimonadota bacterium]